MMTVITSSTHYKTLLRLLFYLSPHYLRAGIGLHRDSGRFSDQTFVGIKLSGFSINGDFNLARDNIKDHSSSHLALGNTTAGLHLDKPGGKVIALAKDLLRLFAPAPSLVETSCLN